MLRYGPAGISVHAVETRARGEAGRPRIRAAACANRAKRKSVSGDGQLLTRLESGSACKRRVVAAFRAKHKRYADAVHGRERSPDAPPPAGASPRIVMRPP